MKRFEEGSEVRRSCGYDLMSKMILALCQAKQFGSVEHEGRIVVAIDALTNHMLSQIESGYASDKYQVDATIEKSFTVEAPNSEAARRQIEESVRENGGEVTDARVEVVHD